MNKTKAKLIYKHNSYEVVEPGDFVLCSISNKEIPLNELNYWSVENQEAYYSPKEVQEKIKKQKKIK